MVQCPGLRVHLLGEVVAQRVDLGEIDRDPGRTEAPGHFEHVEAVALPRHDGRHAALPERTGGPRGRGGIARLGVQKFEVAGHRIGGVARFDGPGIGLAHPSGATRGVAQPRRVRHGIKQGAPKIIFPDHRRVAVAQSRELQPVAGHVPEPQDRSSADGSPFGLDMAARHRDESDAEAFAAASKTFHRMIELLSRRGRQPGSEPEDAARDQDIGDEGKIALDIGFPGRRAPGHDDLGFSRQEHLGPVEPGAEVRQFLVELTFVLGPTATARKVQQRRHGREQGEAHEERNTGDLAMLRHAVDRETPNIGRGPGRGNRTRKRTDGGRGGRGFGRRRLGRSRKGCGDPGVSSRRCAVERWPDDSRATHRWACRGKAVEQTTPSLRRLSPFQALPPLHKPCPLRPCDAVPRGAADAISGTSAKSPPNR